MYRRRNTKSIILTVLIILSFVMIIGYSALSSKLVINGTSNITSNFRVLFTDIQEGTMNSAETKDTSFEATTATFHVDLKKPGSTAEYILTVENQGSLDAYLESIEGIDEANAASPTYITFKLKDITRYTRLDVGDTKTFKVIVTYDQSATEIPTNSKQLTLTLNFAQVSGEIPDPEPEPLGNAVEYLLANKVESTVVDGGNGLVAIDNIGEITTISSPREYRYIGPNPDNYVQFNNELWRIIGIFDGKLKLIRNESISSYSWDNKPSGTGSSTSSYGSNDWSDSALQEVLNNGPYYNRTSGNCPSGQNGATTSCDFSSNGLTEESKLMIDLTTWKLGGTSSYTSASNGLAQHFYEYERGTTVYSGRPTEWTGYIGLIYPSDYGFATSGGSTTGRSACLAKELYNWDVSSYSDCKNNSWLYDSSNAQWTLTPLAGNSYYVFFVNSSGSVDLNGARYGYGVRPSLNLKSEIEFVTGTGSESDPYILR